MKLDSKSFALSWGTTAAIAFIICAILVAISPLALATFFSWWFHYDLTALARPVTVSSFIGGTILTFVFGYIFGWLIAFLYNRFARK